MKILCLVFFMLFALQASCQNKKTMDLNNEKNIHPEQIDASKKIVKTEAEWLKILGKEAFEVIREKGTERPYVGKYTNNKQKGKYICAACKNLLFTSDTKFDSGCGWPSFYAAQAKDNIIIKTDRTHGMIRTEIMCAKCDGHLGHLFDDGPNPTGLRYCVNSISVEFVAD